MLIALSGSVGELGACSDGNAAANTDACAGRRQTARIIRAFRLPEMGAI